MRLSVAALAAAGLVLQAVPAAAQDRAPQARPPQTRAAREHVRGMIDIGEQVTTSAFAQPLTFQQYQEEGSLTLDRTVAKNVIYDGGAAIRLTHGLHVGATLSYFKDTGTGTVAAQVPHPLYFNQPRTTTGDVGDITRKETAAHLQLSWTLASAGGIEFTPFGGPTIFQTEQTVVSAISLSLASEVYPYDTVAFPGVTLDTVKEQVYGYNAGVDMTWRFARNVGLGVLIRYAHGSRGITPPGGEATKLDVGGLDAGGGLRLIF